MPLNKYQCYFCGNEIVPDKIDITSIIVISNWDKEENKQQEQQLFCHLTCLKERLYNNVPLFITEAKE